MEKQAENSERLEILVENLIAAEEERNKQISNQIEPPVQNKTERNFVDTSEPVMKKGLLSRLFNKKE